MGEDGICRTKVKKGAHITIVEAKENSEAVISFQKGNKYPIIVDSTEIGSMTKEARDFLSLRNRPSPVSGIAIIIGSPLSKVIGNFFIGLNKSRVPNKLFITVSSAEAWAKRFIEK